MAVGAIAVGGGTCVRDTGARRWSSGASADETCGAWSAELGPGLVAAGALVLVLGVVTAVVGVNIANNAGAKVRQRTTGLAVAF
jgi:hypothetical protein